MKRSILFLVTFIILTGCAMNQGTPEARRTGVNRVIYAPAVPHVPPQPLNASDVTPNGGRMGNQPYGLIQLTRSDFERLKQNPDRFDRTALARLVAQALSSLPNLADTSVLVTDDHVFVGFTPASKGTASDLVRLDRQVKKASEGVLPRYYRVVTSTDRSIINEVLRLADGDGDRVDEELDRLLNRKGYR